MRIHSNTNKPESNRVIRISLSISAPIIAFFVLNFLFATIIANTNLSENYESIIAVIISSVTCAMMSMLLTLSTKVKAIYNVLIVFVIIVFFKMIINILLKTPVALGRQGIVGIIFALLFSVIGGMIGVFFKK